MRERAKQTGTLNATAQEKGEPAETDAVFVPQYVLTPGKYVFEIATGDSNRKRRAGLRGGFEGQRKPDCNSSDDSRTGFEDPGCTTEAIPSWFYAGDQTGWEFVYPQAQSLAARGEYAQCVKLYYA